ncbi:MAG: bifunctional diaminohydroxyphosphoribosylaminopyrimidine deaminase/5-amino-6-(5-phosphoribosylamino)uracil reductase RibD, partial [Candidatus Dadabacteria bacterium]|nr:bifunctional diaminohydroxyphosphoribosylaminopyrimidine deaminase/5-amino-6-(5-phosphoribosylamino)uracil reductase RibD [Candidatus Dadabacteria bacterium]
MPRDQHRRYMSMALKLARKAEGMTSPNPLVGAVLVKGGKIIGKGYHKMAGLPHAEIEAIADAERNKHNVKGAALYVTLEPCCHEDKRTPPCVNAIIEKGIKRVVVAAGDPNPRVCGNGFSILRDEGVEVIPFILEEKALELNEAYNKYITEEMPFVTLKLAATLDGKIAAHTGDSKWIGSERQRKLAHRLRSASDAVVVGVETVLKDDPKLNARLPGREIRQPVPVILDRTLRPPPGSRVFSAHGAVIIATVKPANPAKKKRLEEAGARVLEIGHDRDGRPDMKKLMRELGRNEIVSVLVEGGGKAAASALKAGIVDKIAFFYAPKILGGDGV